MNCGQHLRLKETREQAMSDTNVDAIVGKSQQNKMGRPPRANTPSINVNRTRTKVTTNHTSTENKKDKRPSANKIKCKTKIAMSKGEQIKTRDLPSSSKQIISSLMPLI